MRNSFSRLSTSIIFVGLMVGSGCPSTLEGETGPQGPTGAQGVQGPQGAQGPQGVQGPQGAQGLTGAQGDAGASSLSLSVAEPAGANCPEGGTRVELGVDLDGDGVLSPGEVNFAMTRFICNGLTGAMGPQGVQGSQGPQGVQGLSSLTLTAVEPAGANCATGGTKVQFGVDADSNGSLTAEEINATLTRYVCDGAVGAQGLTGAQGSTGAQGPVGATGAVGPVGPTGATGPTGPTGAQGSAGATGLASLALTSTEAVGANCATGGMKFESGVDADRNGALSAWEIEPWLTRYVCNGAAGAQGLTGEQGPTGAQGPVGATGAVGPVGPTGAEGPTGAQGLTGATGAQGFSSLSLTTAEAAGLNCPVGGTKLQFGVDADGDGSLSAGEVNAALTRYVCDGAGGAQGATGAQGPVGATGAVGPVGPTGATGPTGSTGEQGLTGATGPQGFASLSLTSAEAAGLNCPVGGTKLQFGVDADGNGSLSAGEINATLTRYVCNGAVGAEGPPGSSGRLSLYDASSNLLGTVVGVTVNTVQVMTSAGYLVYINWNGTITPEQFYYTGPGCTGDTLLNSGWSGALPLYGKALVYSGLIPALMIPTTVGADGLEVLSTMTSSSVHNHPNCTVSVEEVYGWYVSAATPAAVGLPSLPPFATPLRLE